MPVQEAVSGINEAVESGSLSSLLRTLLAEDAGLSNVNPQNVQWYMDILSKATKDKAEVSSTYMTCIVHTCICLYMFYIMHLYM